VSTKLASRLEKFDEDDDIDDIVEPIDDAIKEIDLDDETAHELVPNNDPVNVVAVTPPGNEVFPDPSNKVAVLVNEVNTPVYCLTCIGSVPSSAVAISTKPPFVAVPPILIRN
jgi:hypothetical protein